MKNRRLINLPLAIVVLTFLMLTTVTLIGQSAEPPQTNIQYPEDEVEQSDQSLNLQFLSITSVTLGFLLVVVRRQW